MTVTEWTEDQSRHAQALWLDYQQRHDLSGKKGQTAGVDPVKGTIWIGDSIQDVIAQRDVAGSTSPLYFVRVGFPTYYRKRGRR